MADNDTLALYPGAPQGGRFLTAFPLLSHEPVELPYAPLTDAIAAGTLSVTEVGEGSVPELVAKNVGETDVLVLDGEQLVGAKQNRMASRSLLLPRGRVTRLPVSCIERGRWRFDRRDFRSSSYHSPGRVRRKVRDLEARLARAKTVAADDLARAQSDVWSEIGALSKGLGARSPTDALDEVSETVRPGIEDESGRFALVEGQVGLLAFAGGAPLSLDVIGGRDLYARVHERLVRGYLLDALAVARAGRPDSRGERPSSGVEGPGGRAEEVDEADALRFLALVGRASRDEASPVGRGRYLVLSGTVVGAELVDDGRLVHRSAFPVRADGEV